MDVMKWYKEKLRRRFGPRKWEARPGCSKLNCWGKREAGEEVLNP